MVEMEQGWNYSLFWELFQNSLGAVRLKSCIKYSKIFDISEYYCTQTQQSHLWKSVLYKFLINPFIKVLFLSELLIFLKEYF